MPRTTLASIAKAILDLYQFLVAPKNLWDVVDGKSLIGKRLFVLRELGANDRSFSELPQEHQDCVRGALLDAIALQMASGHRDVYSDLAVDDPLFVGTLRERQSMLADTNPSRQLDWHFQLLVQGWVATHGPDRPKDLRRQKRFRSRKVCDFALTPKDGQVELVECKRIHPGANRAGSVADAKCKINHIIPNAGEQLRSTAGFTEYQAALRHLMVDVSGYSSVEPTRLREHSRCGVSTAGFASEEIEEILDSVVATAALARIDTVTLCWNRVISIDDQVSAIVHDCRSRQVSSQKGFEYGGWTVESYHSKALGNLLKVSTQARTVGWIVDTFVNYQNPSVIGPSVPI